MKYSAASEFPLTDEACREATGRTFSQWYEWIASNAGSKTGRRDLYVKLCHELKVPNWWATTIAVEYERHRDLKKKDGFYEGYGICATKTISAPAERLYGAWASAAELARWFGAGTQADVVDGGAYSNKDGDRGRFLRVRPGKDLRLSWENPALSSATLVDVVFSDKGGGKSNVMVNHTRIQTRPEADGLRAAWNEALEKLKKLLEA